MLVAKEHTQSKKSVIFSCLWEQLKEQLNNSINVFGFKKKKASFSAKEKENRVLQNDDFSYFPCKRNWHFLSPALILKKKWKE